MQIKESRCPEGHYVCPDGECNYSSSREDKIPKHVISHHNKQRPLLEKAKDHVGTGECTEEQESQYDEIGARSKREKVKKKLQTYKKP